MCVGANWSTELCCSCWPPHSSVFNYSSGGRKHKERKKKHRRAQQLPGCCWRCLSIPLTDGSGARDSTTFFAFGRSLPFFLIPFSPPSLLPPQPRLGSSCGSHWPFNGGAALRARGTALRAGGGRAAGGGGGGVRAERAAGAGGAGSAPHRSARCGTGAAAARLCAEPREGAVGCAAPGCRRCPPCSGSP